MGPNRHRVSVAAGPRGADEAKKPGHPTTATNINNNDANTTNNNHQEVRR